VPSVRNAAVHRFLLAWQVSLAVKVVALAVLVFVVAKVLGGV
jgi:hypothetical protein